MKKEKKKAPVKIKGNKNHKAFSVANIVRTKRTQQRNLDRAQKKELIPLINREEELPPPALVVVMGPKGVGKSTLIRSLVKIYTGQNLSDTVGPITVIAGRKRRVTFMECPLDILSMTDLAKTADLVLLMIDASYGFEMETFEFLNLLQLHGFPKVMGVLTNLDKFKANKSLQTTKKTLKHRFWTEIYKGAKVFEFMGVVNNKYRKHEVKRLSLYVSRVKFRPLVWRNTHPYVVADRVEDVTSVTRINQEGSKCDRDVTLYGYVRGSHLKQSMKIHLIGAGDFEISAISALSDPCPLPGGKGDKNTVSLKNKKDSLLYAPLANIGRVSMDKDGTYIEIKNVHYTKKEHLHLSDMQNASDDQYAGGIAPGGLDGATPMELLRSMQDVQQGVDTQLKKSGGKMSLFAKSSHSGSIQSTDTEGESDDDQSDNEEEVVSDKDEDEDEDEDEEDHDSPEEGEEEQWSDEENDNEKDDDELEDDTEGSEDDDSSDEDQIEDGEVYFAPQNIATTAAATFSGFVSTGNSNSGSGIGGFVTRLPSLEDEEGSSLSRSQQANAKAAKKAHEAEADSDLMRLVYGANWALALNGSAEEAAAGDNGKRNLHNDEEDDDELFSFKKFDSSGVSAVQQLYQTHNAIDSSRSNVRKASSSAVVEMQEQLAQLNLINNQKKSTKGLKEKSTASASVNGSKIHSNWLHSVRMRFVTGNAWTTSIGPDGSAVAVDGPTGGYGDDDEYGDFEDLQTGEVFGGGKAVASKNNRKGGDESNSDADEEEIERRNIEIDKQLRALNASKKASFKAQFDKSYDNKKQSGKKGDGEEAENGGEVGDDEEAEDSDIENKADDDLVDITEEERKYLAKAKRAAEELKERNRLEFGEEGELARVQHEGFRQGLYVRILLKKVPYEFTANFRAHLPVILGGLLPHECAMGFINARVKRHRWHKRILKSNDPLIFSIGWRRFQSIPVYTMEDQNERERYLKYTPEHMHCTATFYGPLVPPNTGILAYQQISSSTAGFRISLTGTALEQRATPSVVKKLKLVGTPTKIYKNTAFISGMFNTALEVAKFEGAKLKTVSGIRGSIKKAMRDGATPGTFRASFEDKILMSDLVICRLWVPVEIKQFYNPVLSLLAPSKGKNSNDEASDEVGDSATGGLNLMRTTREIRVAEKIPQKVNKDSLYKPIERKEREFKKLKIPSKLQEALPFKSKPKVQTALNRESYLAKRAVVLDPEERKSRAAVQMLATIKKSKIEKRQAANSQRQSKKSAEKERDSTRFADFHKETKKRKYSEKGKETAARAKKAAKRGD